MNNTTHISSVQNTKVKQWASLLEKKHRERSGQFIIEGVHLVLEAVQAGIEIECIVYDTDKGIPAELKTDAPSATPCEWVSAPTPVLAKCTGTTTPPPVFAVVTKPAYSREALFNERALVVVLDGVSDPGNVGTIIRCADAAGADAVVLGNNCADVYNPKTVRSTMGSLFHLPVIEADLATLLPEGKRRGIRLTGTSLQAKGSCYDCDWAQATWLVMGNESKGLSPEVEQILDETVRIPMRGKAESLNVAMATTVLLYEALRQREF
ncbi:TrmH family RNA methyltransferase [Paenibacillus sp. GCM10012307]|uniref:RNA methyltransferase n=1 Tax=Paenibacillus roseus TaxID=2798579 RepID=A0A934J7Y0_9BACL|nr:RNA methyltransferase [Paenibacillus roseus]MBJ6362376.1 RNA methyltransferase [Paenibacillus roseus]